VSDAMCLQDTAQVSTTPGMCPDGNMMAFTPLLDWRAIGFC